MPEFQHQLSYRRDEVNNPSPMACDYPCVHNLTSQFLAMDAV
jgi:hypothetical protein